MTESNLADARRLCIHGHAVAREGPWSDPGACWLNGLYSRLVPGHAIEMTAAWLDTSVREIVAAQRLRAPSPGQTRRLAAVVHLCGRTRAAEYARRGFRTAAGERCGDQDVARYVTRVEALARLFEGLRAPTGSSR
jgi:hypothetical protein